MAQIRVDRAAAKIVYDEAKAANDEINEILKSFRSNSTVVLGLVTGAATFLAFSDSTKGTLFWVALLGYGAAVGLVASIFWPIDWSHFPAYDAHQALRDPDGPTVNEAQALIDLAAEHQAAYDENSIVITARLGIADRFTALLGATALTVLLMLANTAVASPDQPEEPIKVEIVQEQR